VYEVNSGERNMPANRLTFRNKAVTAIAGVAALILSALGVMSAPATRAESQSQSAAAAQYEYDVVSIKIIDLDQYPGPLGTGYAQDGLTANGVRMFWLFRNAYGVTKPQIVGAPSWFDDVRFSIDARLDPATAAELQKLSPDQLMSARQHMLRAILADRFGLKFHLETRDLPAYFLTIAKSGPKLQDAKPGDAGKSNLADINGNRATDFVTIASGTDSWLVGQAASMTTLTEFLSQWALSLSGASARPVVDKTGLTGRYDFAVKFSPETVLVAPTGADSAGSQSQLAMPNSEGPNLFKALQDNLGLKLESGKGPVQVIVIDHVEKPSAN
jgi:uncharacterized protein (TIGR03435 family)